MVVDSFVRWSSGDTETVVVETPAAIQVFCENDGDRDLLVEYARGEIESISDEHSVDDCTLTVSKVDGDERAFVCPPIVCVVLLVKLRKYQRVASPPSA